MVTYITDAGGRTIDNGIDGHAVGVLPLAARQVGDVLPHEPVENT